MLVRFKKTGKTVDSNAGLAFVKIGIAEEVKPLERIEPIKASVKPANESKPTLKKHKRGRPKKK